MPASYAHATLTCLLHCAGQLSIPEAETRAVYAPRRVPLLQGAWNHQCCLFMVAVCLRACFLPLLPASACGAASIISGQHHTLALTAQGKLFSCGRPTYGRLGRLGVNVNSDDAEHEPRVRSWRRGSPAAGLPDVLTLACCRR